ncbi:hypothetical protein I7I48_09939 [Histoplasma ohiense]|nr:hypothetical protein I7I48_09939 [Histoplasma ohiense (nom. inval.)]
MTYGGAPGDHSLAFWAFLALQPLPIALPAAAGGQPNNRESVTDYLSTTQNCGLELRRPPPSPYRSTAKIQSSLRPSRAVVVSAGFSGSRSWSTQALVLALSPLRQSVLLECDPRSSGAGPYWVASAQRCASWASEHALAGFTATDSAPLIAQPAPPR